MGYERGSCPSAYAGVPKEKRVLQHGESHLWRTGWQTGPPGSGMFRDDF